MKKYSRITRDDSSSILIIPAREEREFLEIERDNGEDISLFKIERIKMHPKEYKAMQEFQGF